MNRYKCNVAMSFKSVRNDVRKFNKINVKNFYCIFCFFLFSSSSCCDFYMLSVVASRHLGHRLFLCPKEVRSMFRSPHRSHSPGWRSGRRRYDSAHALKHVNSHSFKPIFLWIS